MDDRTLRLYQLGQGMPNGAPAGQLAELGPMQMPVPLSGPLRTGETQADRLRELEAIYRLHGMRAPSGQLNIGIESLEAAERALRARTQPYGRYPTMGVRG